MDEEHRLLQFESQGGLSTHSSGRETAGFVAAVDRVIAASTALIEPAAFQHFAKSEPKAFTP